MSTHEKKPRGATRLTAAVPGALTAVLLVGAVAFGATSLRPSAPDTDAAADAPAASAASEAKAPAFGATVAAERKHEIVLDPQPAEAKRTPDAKEKAEASDAPAKTPAPDEQAKKAEQPAATAKPKAEQAQPKQTDKPKPAPADPAILALEGWVKEAKVKLTWKPYGGEGFEYYKVVRSADATVTWPAGSGDTVIGVIGDANAPWWADKPACGTAWSYRVFAVRSGDGGYVTLGASNVVTVMVPCAPGPTPHQTAAISLDVQVRPGEGIELAWQACGGDGFVAYKVVRSKTNSDPRYPLNDGTELIAAIGDPGQTHVLDGAAKPGETWTYRVLALADGTGGKWVACETPAVAATAE